MIDQDTTTLWTIGLSAASAIATSASAFGAFWTIRRSRLDRKAAEQTKADERLLNHAAATLERAFSALMGNQNDLVIPPPDRLGWLTSARLVIEYQSTKSRISSALLLQECESHEEHWRHQFFMKLNSFHVGQDTYFGPGKIEKTSAIVIHAFSQWPEDHIDPLLKYSSPQEAASTLGVHKCWIQLRSYLGLL